MVASRFFLKKLHGCGLNFALVPVRRTRYLWNAKEPTPMLSKPAIRLLIAVILLFSCHTIAQAQWPQFGGPQRDFRVSEASISQPIRIADWSVELGIGDAAPVVDQNSVFVTEAALDDQGQEAMQVRCIDLLNGQTRWSSLVDGKSYVSQDISESFPVRPIASPVAQSGRIVVVSYGGCVSCLDQRTGKVVWKHDLVSEFRAIPMQFGWASSPWTDGSIVVVACGGPEALVLAFQLDTGEVAWKLSAGEAAFASFSEILSADGSKHLCYVGRDVLIGFDPCSGIELWNYPLPKPKLTNAVTPIALPNGQLLVGGQGFESSRRLQISKTNGKWNVAEGWISKHYPFYCNWLVDQTTQQIIGYNSNVLAGIDLGTGELRWKARGWTDANFAVRGDTVVAIRGDGFLAKAKIAADGMRPIAGSRVVNDRVWTPPVLVSNSALIRGRRTLSAVNLDSLEAIEKIPSGTEVDAMNAMYGQQHENVAALLDKATKEPENLTFDDYHRVVTDRSIRFGEGEYRKILDGLAKVTDRSVEMKIVEDWCKLEPDSIVAFDRWIALLRIQGENEKADQLLEDRLIEMEIEVTVPTTTESSANIYLTGNAAAVNSWKPDGWLLTRADDGRYRTKLKLPKGNFEFKFTRGDWGSVEVRADGGSTSNRRVRVPSKKSESVGLGPFVVQAWKSDLNR